MNLRWIILLISWSVFSVSTLADRLTHRNKEDGDGPFLIQIRSLPKENFNRSSYCKVDVRAMSMIGEEGEFYYLEDAPKVLRFDPRTTKFVPIAADRLNRKQVEFDCQRASLEYISIEATYRRVLNGKERKVSYSFDDNPSLIYSPARVHVPIVDELYIRNDEIEQENKRMLNEYIYCVDDLELIYRELNSIDVLSFMLEVVEDKTVL